LVVKTGVLSMSTWGRLLMRWWRRRWGFSCSLGRNSEVRVGLMVDEVEDEGVRVDAESAAAAAAAAGGSGSGSGSWSWSWSTGWEKSK